MEDAAQEKQIHVTIQGAAQESKFTESAGKAIGNQQSSVPLLNQHKRWLLMALFALLVLFGQSAATLLGRLYYVKGGNSKWLSAFLQVAGFPILLPFLYNTKNRKNNSTEQTKPPSPIFTPFIVNSLVLLTTSSALLVLQNDDSSGSSKSSKGKYIIGFICTLLAAALCSLILSLTQFAINKILKRQRVKELFDFLIYESLVASCILLIGLFASGEWKTLTAEMNKFALGKTSYTMTLMWIAVCWQIFSIGIVGLILKVSSLFANVISTLGLPIVPILAVFMFKDKMSGVKAVAMLLAIWGFISYIYQHYLDDLESKSRKKDVSSNEISLIQN
ncbi:unnamed protein product [Coffea canephora]|uniref:Probable purine permease n=1 Tax=Coffea canephora TaxID=49390 RepID=A0A068UDH4_COFCA|nr:unnamed protein product [Coffea canephora]